MSTVLMIEDNLYDQKLARLLLASSFDFTYAASLADAIEHVKIQVPDAILLDLNLPDSRGLDTLASLVKLFPEIPIVVWSGVAEASEAVRLGADEFILKADGNIDSVHKALASAIAHHKFKSVREDVKALQKLIETDKK